MSTAISPQPDTTSSPVEKSASVADVPAKAPSPDVEAIPHPAMISVESTGTHNYVVPPCFSRSPASGVIYASFPPMNVEAIGQYLNRGFPTKLPLSDLDPHPFVTHDVLPEDWSRFIGDVITAGAIRPEEDTMSAGCWFCIAGLVGVALRHHFRKKIKKDKMIVVCAMVDLWNNYFFQPRQIDVYLAQGRKRISGRIVELVRTDARLADEDNAKSKEDGKEVKVSKSSNVHEDKTFRLMVVPL